MWVGLNSKLKVVMEGREFELNAWAGWGWSVVEVLYTFDLMRRYCYRWMAVEW